MSNLLKDASILLTPTGYDNGSMNAIKPENGDGDFTFSRNSAATRVNAQGLVKNVQILSSNLVSNGDFSQEGSELVTNGNFATDTDWSKDSNWSISNGSASANGTSNNNISQSSIIPTLGKTYKITFEVLTISQGYFQARLGNELGVQANNVGVYTSYVTATTNDRIRIYAKSLAIGSITNISVKEVGQDWTITGSDANNYVEFGDGTARLKFLNTSPLTQLITSFVMTAGKKYKLTVDVLTVTSGGIKVDGNGISETFNTPGITTRIINPTGATPIRFYRATGNVDITLNSVSLIEITDDTNLPRINYEGFSYQDSLGSELVTNGDFATDSNWTKLNATISGGTGNLNGTGVTSLLYQNILTNGKTYKVTFTASDYNGLGQARVIDNSGSTIYIITSNGTFTFTFTHSNANGNFLFRATAGAIFSINNVSVKEVLGQEVVPNSGCGSWLFEPQSTNLITYSSDLTQGITNRLLITSNTNSSPDGTNTADKLIPNNTNSAYHYFAFSSLTIATNNVYSVFLKKAEYEYALISFETSGSSGSSDKALINLNNGTIEQSDTETKVENYGNGWYRCSIKATSSRTSVVIYPLASASLGSFTGDNVSGILAWGLQLEQNSFSTSYIPTQGATSTRLQDIANNSANASLINSEEGVLYAEIAALTNDLTNRFISISNGSKAERVEIGYSNVSNKIFAFSNVGNVNQCNISFVLPNMLDYNKIALKYKLNDFSLWVNGVKVGVDLNASVSAQNTLNELAFDEGDGTDVFYSKTKALAVFKTALTDAQLTALTTI